MASKHTVTLDNLAALGAERLAAILVELADSDAEVKRHLRLELAARTGGDAIAAEIGKRIAEKDGEVPVPSSVRATAYGAKAGRRPCSAGR